MEKEKGIVVFIIINGIPCSELAKKYCPIPSGIRAALYHVKRFTQ